MCKIIIKKINYAFIFSSCLRCDTLQWKRLLVMEEFENGPFSRIMQAAFGKMGFKSALDLPTWKLPKFTAKK